MHTSKHKAQHHPLFVCLLCSPIKFFIGFMIPLLLVLESWSRFIFHRNLCVPEMEQEQTPKQVVPEYTETIQVEEQDAKREFNMWVLNAALFCSEKWYTVKDSMNPYTCSGRMIVVADKEAEVKCNVDNTKNM